MKPHKWHQALLVVDRVVALPFPDGARRYPTTGEARRCLLLTLVVDESPPVWGEYDWPAAGWPGAKVLPW